MSKVFTECLCGCGRPVRIYRSRRSRFHSRECYLRVMRAFRLIRELGQLLGSIKVYNH